MKLAYDRAGRGSPTLLLHAFIADRRMWQPQLSLLTDEFDLIAADLPGSGASPAPTEPFSPRAVLVDLLDDLRLEQVDLIGSSSGGTTALDFTLEYPDRVRRLALVGAGIGGMPLRHMDRDLYSDVETAEARGDLDAINEAQIRLWLDGPRRPAGHVGEPARSLVLRMNRDLLHAPAWDGALRQALDPPAASRLGEVGVPTLVMVGAYDLPHCHGVAEIMARSIPGSRLEVVPDTAHLPSLERPDLFNRLLEGFLRSL